jgi:hypothetical protein
LHVRAGSASGGGESDAPRFAACIIAQAAPACANERAASAAAADDPASAGKGHVSLSGTASRTAPTLRRRRLRGPCAGKMGHGVRATIDRFPSRHSMCLQ